MCESLLFDGNGDMKVWIPIVVSILSLAVSVTTAVFSFHSFKQSAEDLAIQPISTSIRVKGDFLEISATFRIFNRSDRQFVADRIGWRDRIQNNHSQNSSCVSFGKIFIGGQVSEGGHLVLPGREVIDIQISYKTRPHPNNRENFITALRALSSDGLDASRVTDCGLYPEWYQENPESLSVQEVYDIVWSYGTYWSYVADRPFERITTSVEIEENPKASRFTQTGVPDLGEGCKKAFALFVAACPTIIIRSVGGETYSVDGEIYLVAPLNARDLLVRSEEVLY
jgi:hypothetical protein